MRDYLLNIVITNVVLGFTCSMGMQRDASCDIDRKQKKYVKAQIYSYSFFTLCFEC